MQKLYKELAHHFPQLTGFLTNTKKEVAKLHKIFRKHKVKKILDVACGTGRHSVPLAKLGYKVTGIDYSKFQIREAQKYAKGEEVKVKFLLKDANNFLFRNRFDAVICMWTTIGEEPMVYEQVISNVYKSLKKDGVFVIDNNTWEYIPKSRKQHIKNKIDIGKDVLEQSIYDRFTEHFRIREAIIKIGGKKYADLCITQIKKPYEWAEELKKAGFVKTKIISNYKVEDNWHTKRNALVIGIK
ncbi:MAG: class I SAM-dependent methyltransferase [bacterium]|nr:class I SAM-dependent methyltransferase [bacterium]